MNYLISAKLVLDNIEEAVKIGKEAVKTTVNIAEEGLPIIDSITQKVEDAIYSPVNGVITVLKGGDKPVDIKSLNFTRDDIQDAMQTQLLKATIPTYGNWAGPAWSAGQRGLSESQIDWKVPAIDSIDKIAKIHDYMYGFDNIPNNEIIADQILMDNVNQLIQKDPSYEFNPYLIAMRKAFDVKIKADRLLYGNPDPRLKQIMIDKTSEFFNSIGDDINI